MNYYILTFLNKIDEKGRSGAMATGTEENIWIYGGGIMVGIASEFWQFGINSGDWTLLSHLPM